MPYNLSRHVVTRHQMYLDMMLTAKRDLSWPSADPASLAYKLREALKASEKYFEFSKYQGLSKKYKICIRSGWVTAEWQGPRAVPRLVITPERMVIEEAIDAQGVVGACIHFAVRADELYFPKAFLNVDDLRAIYDWGRTISPPWKVINQEERGVTMTRKKGTDRMFLWEPPEEEEKGKGKKKK